MYNVFVFSLQLCLNLKLVEVNYIDSSYRFDLFMLSYVAYFCNLEVYRKLIHFQKIGSSSVISRTFDTNKTLMPYHEETNASVGQVS